MKVTLSCGVLELALDHPPANEIGSTLLEDLERVSLDDARVLILHSTLDSGFCAGADLRELYRRGGELSIEERVAAVREFLERIHAVLNRIDEAPIPTIAATAEEFTHR